MKSPSKLDIIEKEVPSLSNSVNIEEEDEAAEADQAAPEEKVEPVKEETTEPIHEETTELVETSEEKPEQPQLE